MKKILAIGVTLLATLSLAACGSNSSKDSSSSSKTSSSVAKAKITINTGLAKSETAPTAGTLVMRQGYAAAHGTQSVAAVNVTLNGDTIVAAKINEFQYVDKSSDWTGVPNSANDFGKSYPKGQFLIGKAENTAQYSALMKKEGKATQTWAQNMSDIENYVKGKKVSDLKTTIADLKKTKKTADVVSGSTFASTQGYVQAIYDVATKGMTVKGVATTDNNVTEGQILAAPHGKQSFGIITVAMQNNKVANVFVDEFQYTPSATFGALPNSDADFGKGIKSGTVLASKRANSKAYSALMTKEAKATHTWAENSDAIAAFANGKTIAELETAVGNVKKTKKVADVVSGATFADTAGYLQAIIDAAKAAK